MPTTSRAILATLARASKTGLISVADAAKALGSSESAAAIRLARLTRRGWLRRARRGLYLVVPLEADPGQRATAEDPWVLADQLFAPCYIGGWSAAEHWGLTEQLFRSTLVVTSAAVRATNVENLGHAFRLFRVPRSRLSAGVVREWRGKERVAVSGPELAQSLTELGLIDEYRLYVQPIVLGRGKPFFAGPRPPLRFVSADPVGEDTMRLTYAPA